MALSEDEKNEIIARVLQAVGATNIQQQAYTLPTPQPKGGGVLNFVGSLILIGLCIFGLWAMLVIYVPGFAGTSETVYSTPGALPLPSARVAAPGSVHIVEATFPAPVPEDGIGDSGYGIREAGNPEPRIPNSEPRLTPTPWPPDDAATEAAETSVAAATNQTAAAQGLIDRWLNGPPSTPTPTTWNNFVESFSTPEPCSQFIGRVGAARAACPTPEE